MAGRARRQALSSLCAFHRGNFRSSDSLASHVSNTRYMAIAAVAGEQSSSSQNSNRSSLAWLAALPFALAPLTASCDDGGTPYSMLGLEKKRRIFFKYEKRVRDNSTLSKSFDYFSSLEKVRVCLIVMLAWGCIVTTI